MILWDNTEKEFGYNESNTPSIRKRPLVIMQCDGCGNTETKKLTSKNKDSDHFCRSCVGKNRWKSQAYRNKTVSGIKKAWKNDDYRLKQEARKVFGSEYNRERWRDPAHRSRMSESLSKSSKKLWKREDYRNKMEPILELNRLSSPIMRGYRTDEEKEKLRELAVNRWKNGTYDEMPSKLSEIWSSDEMIQVNSERSKELWKNEEYRNKIIAKLKEKWNNEEFRNKVLSSRKVVAVSSIQKLLYSILDDLGVEYYREYEDKEEKRTIIGPYHFDCVVPIGNKKLLIECQGEYWHSSDKSIARDKSKATYIEKYHNNCEIKYLWEHEFSCPDKVMETIKYWLGITNVNVSNFSFDNVVVKECPAKDYKLLLSKYHYLPNAGRGGMSYGAYLGDELIAVCVFSPLIRQNLPWDKKSTRELSRLCIHPRYQKKNFASWFVSRCIKSLDHKYKTIISYCDTTFNHDGATYKACNFKLDGEVKPDYWYVAGDGWVMHKKTLYNHARKMSITEKDYALLSGYEKVYGNKKLRFVFKR